MSLTPRDEARRLNSPPLQGRGRGWGLTVERIDQLQDRGGVMRRNPTEPEARLWARLSRSQLGGFKFRRQAVIAERIVDFLSPATGLVIEVDGDTHVDTEADSNRDRALATLGYRVVRVTNADVMNNMDGVLAHLLTMLETMPARRRPHPNPSPEGEGLSGL